MRQRQFAVRSSLQFETRSGNNVILKKKRGEGEAAELYAMD